MRRALFSRCKDNDFYGNKSVQFDALCRFWRTVRKQQSTGDRVCALRYDKYEDIILRMFPVLQGVL